MMKPILCATVVALIATAAVADDTHSTKHHVALDNVEWFEAPIPGVQLAHLWGDDETGARWFFKMGPGVALPMHTHTSDYRGMTIQGNWVHIEADGTEVATGAGDYSLVRGGVPHADRCDSDVPCIGLLDFAGPRDVALAK
ncbi:MULTISPECIES: cupin domain-containing protein [unclassified Minwuia]|jgi:anti-sigma factor ChrR (cupin superfamily)|uniref:cupin domain-containing protein n=1 Tax=unclassified Minwuia TaxID=2618799 RepID=UPI00247A8147|nr:MULTISPECIES: cupin domain-containing protein [unclassified Minwuia]